MARSRSDTSPKLKGHHWTARDEAKIRKALTWAAEHPAKASDVEDLAAKAEKSPSGKRRGR
jgi:hypothetical protein